MLWKLVGTVTNTNLPEPSGMTPPALATTPRSRGHGCKAGRLGCNRWLCALVRRVPRRGALMCVLHENDFLGFLGEKGKGGLKEVSRD